MRAGRHGEPGRVVHRHVVARPVVTAVVEERSSARSARRETDHEAVGLLADLEVAESPGSREVAAEGLGGVDREDVERLVPWPVVEVEAVPCRVQVGHQLVPEVLDASFAEMLRAKVDVQMHPVTGPVVRAPPRRDGRLEAPDRLGAAPGRARGGEVPDRRLVVPPRLGEIRRGLLGFGDLCLRDPLTNEEPPRRVEEDREKHSRLGHLDQAVTSELGGVGVTALCDSAFDEPVSGHGLLRPRACPRPPTQQTVEHDGPGHLNPARSSGEAPNR